MINRRKRRDTNHAEVKEALEARGWQVVDTSQLGGDVPDLLCCKRNRWMFVEVKSPKGELTLGQMRFKDYWDGDVFTVRSLADVTAIK